MAAKKRARPEPDEAEEAGGRALWKGSINFGLIDIPVSLHAAERRNELRFSMVDDRDLSPIRYERVSAKTGKPVPWEHVAKGREQGGRFVTISEDELRAATPEATQTIDIHAFVDGDEIPPEYFVRPYHLVPTKRGRKGYALLLESLKKSGRVAIAKVVIRTRQHLAAVVPRGNALVLEILRWPVELKDAADAGLAGVSASRLGITAKEVEMASRLIEGMVEEWEPDKYEDTYRKEIHALIAKKAKTGRIAPAEVSARRAERGPEVVDFMSLLKKSIEQKAGSARASAARNRSAPARRRAKTA